MEIGKNKSKVLKREHNGRNFVEPYCQVFVGEDLAAQNDGNLVDMFYCKKDVENGQIFHINPSASNFAELGYKEGLDVWVVDEVPMSIRKGNRVVCPPQEFNIEGGGQFGAIKLQKGDKFIISTSKFSGKNKGYAKLVNGSPFLHWCSKKDSPNFEVIGESYYVVPGWDCTPDDFEYGLRSIPYKEYIVETTKFVVL